jgi:hypothetical protein
VGSLENFVHLVLKGLGTKQLWGLLLQAAFELGSAWYLQRMLLDRMTDDRRARGWNALSQATAILHVGGLSMIPFVWVTRDKRGVGWGALALVIGVAWAALLVGLSMLSSELIDWVFDVTP